MALHSGTCTPYLPLALYFLSSPILLQFQLQHAFLPCEQHHTIRAHCLQMCFFSDVFSHGGKQETGSLVESNFHRKGFACSCSTPHHSFALMAHVLHQSDVLLQYPLFALSHAPIQFFPRDSVLCFFSRSMDTQCKSCCPSAYLSCSHLSAKIASVVDFPFMNPNCCSLILTMFLSRFSCTLSYSSVLWHISLITRANDMI